MNGRFQGYVDGVFDGELAGWALDPNNPGTPTVVTIAVDGVPLTRTLACQHRADVGAAYGTSGLHGFKVLLPDSGTAQVVEIAVICEDGQRIGNGARPLRVNLQQAGPRVRREGPCVLFMHIQKTAGTAFRHAILSNYAGSEVALIYPTPPGIWREQFPLMPQEQRRGLRCVLGHFKYGIHDDLGQPYEYVTILRDPVQRVISDYHHLLRNDYAPVFSPDGEAAPLETLLERGAVSELDNLLTRCFCGKFALDLGRTVNQEWYERALENLPQFRFIGHQERADAAWADLCRLYGWNLGALEKVNVASESKQDVSARTLAAIAEYNRYDLLLYRKVMDGPFGFK